jgi:hypothetical protein
LDKHARQQQGGAIVLHRFSQDTSPADQTKLDKRQSMIFFQKKAQAVLEFHLSHDMLGMAFHLHRRARRGALGQQGIDGPVLGVQIKPATRRRSSGVICLTSSR